MAIIRLDLANVSVYASSTTRGPSLVFIKDMSTQKRRRLIEMAVEPEQFDRLLDWLLEVKANFDRTP